MDDKKRNITGSYPGSGGAKPQKKVSNPSGSYPGKKAAPKAEPPKPQEEIPAVPSAEDYLEPENAAEETVQKKRVRFSDLFSKKTMKKFSLTIGYYALILLTSVLLATWICSAGNELLGLVRPDKEITFTIEEGKNSVSEVTDVLEEADLIDHTFVFKLYCGLKNAEGTFQSGEYTINCQSDYNQIIRALQQKGGNKTMVEFVVNPGDTQEELVTTLCDTMKVFERAELEEVLQSYDFSDYSFLSGLPARNYQLEGYLYPGTYKTFKGESPVALVRHILDRFEEEVLTEENQKKIKDSGYSLDQLVTLASILQAEGGKELNKAASVYFNRLKDKDFPYLESQATLCYILPMANGTVTAADLLTNDPYNTYLSKGLPPSAICSPGAEAIAAVLKPTKTDYMYFVTQSDNETLFAINEADHKINLKKAGEDLRGTGTVA
ncbi:MAG: endolytic transglycosylase MltG [Clostridia bacterium]|nr:endolytic transglycosylase MltG [Clostridia bacterium]